VDHPEPALQGPTDVAVRVLEVGICGTDREIAAFQYGFPPPGQRSLVIGHECLAEVIEVGREVDRVAVGDRVVPMVRRPCRRADCLACPRGRQDFCYTGEFTERGIQGAHGFMTERVVDDQRFMHRVPRELRDVGVLVEPLTIAEKALIQVRDVQERLPWECRQARESGQAPPLRALVLGAGPVGLLGAMALRNAGFETTVYSREPRGSAKARLVEQFGGRYVSAGDHDAGALQRTLGRVDLVYEAVGASRLAFEVLEVLGSNAVFVFTGVPGRKAPVEVDTASVMRNMVLDNQVLLGTVNAGPDAFEAAVGDLAAFRRRWPEALGSLITGRYPLDKHAELLQGERTGIKNVLQVGGG
jgi:threonine dehydrogenase-like Zn-dependent dehydrogenase